MVNERQRFSPYIWATWLAADLAGQDQCAWKPWYKAHYEFEKRPDENAAQLTVWTAEHGAAVRARAELHESAGWAMSVEGQNKFSVRGQHATVGGCADLLGLSPAVPADASVPLNTAFVEDIKTGKRRDSDYWQVVTYMLMLPIAFKELLKGRELAGRVVYSKEGGAERPVTLTAGDRARVFARIREIGATTEPPRRVPSAQECQFCNILHCPDRVTEENAPADTQEF